MAGNSNIRETFLSLNKYFEDEQIDNKVLVLDFSHFTKVDENHSNIKTEFFGYKTHTEIYSKELEIAAKDDKIPFRKFTEDNVRIVTNYGKNFIPSDKGIDHLMKDTTRNFFLNERSKNDFKPKMLTETLEGKIGSCMLFVSKAFNNDETQSIVYLTLEKSIRLPIKDKTKKEHSLFDYVANGDLLKGQSRKILKHIFPILEKLLLSEMIHSLYEIGLEKERQSTFNDIWHNTNHLLGSVREKASDIENEILKYVPDYFNENSPISFDIDHVMSQMELLRNINKIGLKGGYFYDLEGNIRPYIKNNVIDINLKSFIEGIVKSFVINIKKYYADTIRPTSNVYKKLRENSELIFDTKKIADDFWLKIEVSTFYNMVIDILINATKYAFDEIRNNEPKVTIWTSNQNVNHKTIDLHIRNERGINRKNWESWMTKPEQKSTDTHLGIRLSKFILDYYNIKYDVPKNCITENGGTYTEIRLSLNSDYKVKNLIE